MSCCSSLPDLFRLHMMTGNATFPAPHTVMPGIQHDILTPPVQPYCFKWTIEKFSVLEKEYKLVSKPFTIDGPEPTKWEMWLYPRGKRDQPSDHISFYLVYLPATDNVTVTNSFLVSLQSTCHNDYYYGKSVATYSSSRTCMGYRDFVAVDLLASRAYDLIPKDRLTLICKGDVLVERCKEAKRFKGAALSADVQEMLHSNASKDVVLVSGEEEFRVHKFILIARSPVFAAMFEHDTEEKKTGRVVFKDLNPKMVRGLIHFLYTDQAPEDMPEMAMDLMAAADKYQISRLQYLCEQYLESTLTVTNVIGSLSFALLHNLPIMKEACLQFAKSNMKEVKESQSWHECTDVDVFKTIADFCTRQSH